MLYRFQERARYTQHGKPLPQSGSGSFPSFYREALQHTPRWTPYVAPLVERCYHQRNGGTGKLPKPMPPKPYEGRSDLILGGLLTTAPAFLVENHKHYLFRLSWYLARRCPAMIPDMQTRTSQCVSVIANRLSCFLQDGSRPWHRLYGTQPACKSWTATDLQVHVLRICKYDYNPKFGKLQDGREKWVESPNLHPIMRFSVV